MESARFHFNGDTSNADLFFSHNKLSKSAQAFADWCDELARQLLDHSFSSVEKLIAKMNEQLNRKVAPEEANTLVQVLETNFQASRNRLSDHKFENLSKEIKVSLTCELVGFMRKVSHGQSFRTNHDIDDGFEGKTGACRENLEPVGWIRGHTKIGPVSQARAT